MSVSLLPVSHSLRFTQISEIKAECKVTRHLLSILPVIKNDNDTSVQRKQRTETNQEGFLLMTVIFVGYYVLAHLRFTYAFSSGGRNNVAERMCVRARAFLFACQLWNSFARVS
jgi:hypothetical protein